MDSAELNHHGIRGMKWGVRRYQNEDGSLTEAGQKRYAKDVRTNAQRAKDKRVDDESLKDPDRWVREDYKNAKEIVDAGKEITSTAQDIVATGDKKNKKPLDLSNMTDEELRAQINRKLLEQQYDNLYNKQEVSKGRKYVDDVLNYGGAVLGIASSAIGIAIAIQKLKG